MKTYAQTISLSGRRKKKLEKQVEKSLNALKASRNDPRLHIELGDTYAQLEAVSNSIKHYYAAIELLRQAPGPGKIKNLIPELYEKVITIAPKEPKAYLDLSEEYISGGQKEKAFRFLLTSAKKAYESEHYELALQCYNQVIAKGRTNPHIVERCTELYLKLGRKDEALQNYIEIGDTYAQEEKNIEALEYYKKACAIDKDNPELILKIARMYNAMAWTENAASELVRVGEFYEKQRDYTEALRYYRYSVRLDPENEKAQEGRRRVVETHPGEDFSLGEMEDGEEREVADVLDELEKIEEPAAVNDDRRSEGKFDMTPIDLNATLTFEGIENAPGDVNQSTEPELEFSLHDIDQEILFNLVEENNAGPITDQEKLFDLTAQEAEPPDTAQDLFFNITDAEHEPSAREPELEVDQTIPAETDLLPLDIEQMLAIEEETTAPETSATRPETTADTISLEDWIIDLKEDELVELALEEALKDQELLSAEVGASPFLRLGGDVAEDFEQDNPTLPALPGQGDDDWMNITDEHAAITIEAEVTKRTDGYLHDERDDFSAQEPSEPFLQIDIEQAANERTHLSAEALPSQISLKVTQQQDVDFEEEYGAMNVRPPEAFRQVDLAESEEPEHGADADLIFNIDLPEQAFRQTTAQNNGNGAVRAFEDDAAARETEWFTEITEPSIAVETQAEQVQVERTRQFFAETATFAEQSEQTPAETAEQLEFPADTAALEAEQFPLPAAEELEVPADASLLDEAAQTPPMPEQLNDIAEDDGFFAEAATFATQQEQPLTETATEQSADTAPATERALEFAEATPHPVQTTPESVEAAGVADFLTAELEQAAAEEEEVVNFLTEPAPEHSSFNQTQVRDNLIEFRQKIEDLEQRLQRTEEEKYFLQERFTAQISRHKANEESLQKEIADIYKNKEQLETRLPQAPNQPAPEQQAPAALVASRGKGSEKFDEARCEALVSKIQSKKTLLQQHLNKLLKKRQENGRFLTEELNNLNATKQRLQSNVEYIQHIKNRLEEKIQTELRQAKQEAQALSQRAQELEDKLRTQQQGEQNLRKQFKTLTKEKEVMQENYTKSLNAFTKEKATLEKQAEQAAQAKKAVERILRSKLQNLHQAYQQVKVEYKTALGAKEAQINQSAHQLSEFTDKYVKLEKTLAEIRKERDKLNTMLVQETTTREMLEDKLVTIESQVDSLEVQGTKLLAQLGQELDRHFDIEQTASDKFQLSLDELEGLLVLQEKEIRSLETL